MIDYTKNLKGWHYYRKKEYNSSITPKAVALWWNWGQKEKRWAGEKW